MRLALVALLGCATPAAPDERALAAALELVPGASTQAQVVGALAVAGVPMECGGGWSYEAGVTYVACSGVVAIAGCQTGIAATFVRVVFEDDIARLTELGLREPAIDDCGPREGPRQPWSAALLDVLGHRLGPGMLDGADRRWRTPRSMVVLHDAHLAACRDDCRSSVAITAGPRARDASR